MSDTKPKPPGRSQPEPAAEASTFLALLRRRALEQPDRMAYTFLDDGETEQVTVTYAELDRCARAIGALLQAQGPPGQHVLLLYPPGIQYLAGFFGCLYAGDVAVPAYPPIGARGLPRLLAVATDAQAGIVLTDTAILQAMEQWSTMAPALGSLHRQATDNLPAGLETAWRDPGIGPDALALLQYTSGSTSSPKGVMVSHRNLLANQRAIKAAFAHDSRVVIAGWLPLYHDMGLIGNVLHPLYLGVPCVLMSPLAFLEKPLRWLRMISRYRATTSGGPNFAYDLCVRKTTPADRGELDLRTWNVAFNGAEPIRRQTIERFTATFEPCGFRKEAFYPCYGLAEATLMVAGAAKSRPPTARAFRTTDLEEGRAVATAGEGRTRTLVGCGRPVPAHTVVITDAERGARLPDGKVGEIWVAGPSVTRGYWNRVEETARTFHARTADGEGPFLRTGDLGFLSGGELFVTGRIKDLVIIRGRNHYPQDIEETVERSHPALRPGCSAAFAVDADGTADEEQLVVVAEVRHGHPHSGLDEVISAIREAVAEQHELQVAAVALIEQGTAPKTSSGKIQRHAARAGYLESSLAVVRVWQLPTEPPPATGAVAPPFLDSIEAVEEWLARLICDALEIPPVDLEPDQPLTRHGLDSVQAVQVAVEIEAATGVNLSVADFEEGLTTRELARMVVHRRQGVEPSQTEFGTPVGKWP